jgi:hypothetical protein
MRAAAVARKPRPFEPRKLFISVDDKQGVIRPAGQKLRRQSSLAIAKRDGNRFAPRSA